MEWVKLSTRYYLDQAVVGLPDADTELMFVRALAYAGAEETGGFIPESVLPSLIRRRRWRPAAEAIAASSLWAPGRGDRDEPGYLITRWQDWQEELEALARRRAADRERKRRERGRRAVDNSAVDNAEAPRKRGRPPREKPVPDTAKPQVKNMSRDMSADSPQTERDKRSISARTREGFDDDLIPVAIDAVREREGLVITPDRARRLIAIIGRRAARTGKPVISPAKHLRTSIGNEHDLYAELLEVPPVGDILADFKRAEQAADLHEYAPGPDPVIDSCIECTMPRANRGQHREAS